MRVAVVAHQRKSLGGGLADLRRRLAAGGVEDPDWYEVATSKKSAKKAREAVKAGVDLVLVWGGDGTVRRCAAELAGTGIALGVLPAGTANLLASNLGIPIDLADALDVALHGERRAIDLGVVNGQRFAVMAGTGFDARMIAAADGALKDRFGRLAYVWTGLWAAASGERVDTEVRVDGEPWFKGCASCVLFGNVREVTGGLVVFEEARPDDGVLDVGVVVANGPGDWLRVMISVVRRQARSSPFVRWTTGKEIDVRLPEPTAWELDGNDRKPTDHLQVHVEPLALVVCVPAAAPAG